VFLRSFLLRLQTFEFDEGFFQQITAPIQKVSGLMVDMEKFLKQLEEVKKQSAMEKEKADKQKKWLFGTLGMAVISLLLAELGLLL
jgi:hypothetical protein